MLSGTTKSARAMPAGSIHREQRVHAWGHSAAGLVEEGLQHVGPDDRQDQGEGGIALVADDVPQADGPIDREPGRWPSSRWVAYPLETMT